MKEIFLLTSGFLLLIFFAHVTTWNAKRRAAMTAEQREREDAEDRIQANIW